MTMTPRINKMSNLGPDVARGDGNHIYLLHRGAFVLPKL